MGVLTLPFTLSSSPPLLPKSRPIALAPSPFDPEDGISLGVPWTEVAVEFE